MNCLHCHKPVEGKRNTKKYCSKTCKQYAYLQRNSILPQNLAIVPLSEANQEDHKRESAENNYPLQGNLVEIRNSTHELTTVPKIQSNESNNAHKEYKAVWPDILRKIQDAFCELRIDRNYFKTTDHYNGRIDASNYFAFAYMIPRLRCIVENLFQLSYKSKIYFKTAKAISKALEEMIMSNHIKELPKDFPFFEDLFKMHEQFKQLTDFLENDKEGIKFNLSKTAVVRNIVIIDLIRDYSKKEPFSKLFPEVLKENPEPIKRKYAK